MIRYLDDFSVIYYLTLFNSRDRQREREREKEKEQNKSAFA